MKRLFSIFIGIVLLVATGAIAEQKLLPTKPNSGTIGVLEKAWSTAAVGRLILPEVSAPSGNPTTNSGWLYVKDKSGTSALYFENDAGSVSEIAVTATAFDDIGDPDAAGTIAFTTYQQTITSTKTDDDGILIQGLGAFGDVSVLRVEQKTGNPTDGTVLEVVAADANVDPLVVSSSSRANALVVGQGAGTVSVAGALTVGGTASVTGILSNAGGISPGSATDSLWKTDTINVTNSQIKALRASPLTLVAAPGAGKFIEFAGATIAMNYGSNVLTESTDNLVIQYNTSGLDASASIETTGFLDQSADMIAVVVPSAIAGAAATSFTNRALELFNSGDGEIAGNAGNDTTLIIKVTYRIHATGL